MMSEKGHIHETKGRGARHDAGFTVFEMLVVVGLLALGALLALPLAGGSARGKPVEIAVRALAGALRSERSAALKANEPRRVLIDVEQKSFWRESEGTRHTFPDSLRLDVTAARAERRGVSVVGLSFFPDGSASGGLIVLSDGRRRGTVGIDWLTGRVRARLENRP